MSPNEIRSQNSHKNQDGINVGEDAAAENDELEIEDIEDDIVEILREYQKRKTEKLASAEVLGNPRHQKRSKFETEEQ